MNRTRPILSRAAVIASLALLTPALYAIPLITDVVETGGDNEATDTVTAKWTGVTFSNGVSGEFLNPYTVGLFGEDVPAYVDRTHQWNGATTALPLPSYLVGGEYIMIGNDNRDNANLKLDVTVSEPVLVYILIDNRLTDASAADPPESGLPFESWTRMTWMATNGFAPVLNGLNRNGDPSIPDEVGVDESADGDIDNWSSVYFKQVEAGTFSLYQMGEGSRNMYGVVVKRLPGSLNNPPEIANVTPANNSLFYDAAKGISFTATTIEPNRLDPAGIKLLLNGVDVSAKLAIGGTAASRSVSYTALEPNTMYKAQISVSDQAARTTTVDWVFDTFDANTVVAIEAEDYNYEGGQFLAVPSPGGYAGLIGTPDVDYHDNNTATPTTEYRLTDYVGLAVTTDSQRPAFASAGAMDYQVGGFLAGDWMNYTRTFPEGKYVAYLRASTTVPQSVRMDKIGADQAAFALGTFAVGSVAATPPFAYVPLADEAGNPLVLAISGVTTLRLTALMAPIQNPQLNFLLFVPTTAVAGPPYVSEFSPAPNAVDVALDAAVKATIANGGTPVAPGSVTLKFSGSDVTSAASIVSSADGVQVAYDPPGSLALNTTCAVSLGWQDTGGTSFTKQWSFTTLTFKPIITGVVETGGDDSLNTPAQYTGQTFSHPNLGTLTVGTFREDVPAYRDRVHQWNGAATTLPLPSYLVGGEYIMIRNDNRDNSPFQVDVTVSEPALVYVLVDNRLNDGDAGTPPDFSAGNMSWLLDGGWAPVMTGYNRVGTLNVPDEVGVDEGGDGVGPGVALNNYSSVYVKEVPAGTFSLYQPDNSGRNMYGVVVRAVATQQFVPTVTITSPVNDTAYPTAPVDITITADAAVKYSTITKVEFFAGVPDRKIGEAASAPYRIVWQGVIAGRYALRAKATAANGQSMMSAPVGVTAGKVISVNFQATTAEVPPGYMADYGDVFADRGNGYSYGWDADNTAYARDRNNVRSPDERYDTFNHMQKALPAGRVWEIEVPNGRYHVQAVVGESDNQDSVYDLQAEGITIVAGTPGGDSWWFEGEGAVTVSDGRLSLSNGPTASNNKVDFVDIAEVPLPAKPAFGQPSLSGATVTITWTGGGKLQEAPEVTGPWTDVEGSPQSPHAVQATALRKFYRAFVP